MLTSSSSLLQLALPFTGETLHSYRDPYHLIYILINEKSCKNPQSLLRAPAVSISSLQLPNLHVIYTMIEVGLCFDTTWRILIAINIPLTIYD